MRVLIACEYSGMVRDALCRYGIDAVSCDLLPSLTSGEHIQGDVSEVLFSDEWAGVIGFPPCTDLCVSGARWFPEKIANGSQQKAINFFLQFTKLSCPWTIENPIGIMSNRYRKPDQIIQPWQFGDSFSKSTCLWLNGLPQLVPSNIVDKGEFVIHGGRKMPKWYSNRERERDMTFPGIAEAMAHQWGYLFL